MKQHLTRRDVLRIGAAVPLVLGCGEPRDAGAPACPAATHDNIEGPYYRAGAPERATLLERGVTGIPLVIEGRVVGPDCRRGLLGAELDVWQADGAGHYDNDGSAPQRDGRSMFLRGKLRTDGDGGFRITTVVPGHYLNGKQYRPAHVHVKVRAAGMQELTTQLYFPDDPYNAIDPFLHEALLMQVAKKSSEWQARFDFVLRAT